VPMILGGSRTPLNKCCFIHPFLTILRVGNRIAGVSEMTSAGKIPSSTGLTSFMKSSDSAQQTKRLLTKALRETIFHS